MKEDRASLEQFIRSMIGRGLRGVRLVVGDRCAGLVATVNAMPPGTGYRRCMVHFMRNVLSEVSHRRMKWAAGALKVVLAVESRESALEKAERVAAQMGAKGLKAAVSCLREGVGKSTPSLLDEYPAEHHRRISTNNMIRTIEQGDPPAHPRRRLVSRRQERAHARLRVHPLRHRQPAEHATLPGHVPTR